MAAAWFGDRPGSHLEVPLRSGYERRRRFFLVFVLFTVLLGYPLLLGEFIFGRRSQTNAIDAYKQAAPKSVWHLTGYVGVAACFLVLSFYSVVGGWILLYVLKAVTGSLSGLTQEQYGTVFGTVIENPIQTLAAQLVFMILTVAVVAKACRKGLNVSVRC